MKKHIQQLVTNAVTKLQNLGELPADIVTKVIIERPKDVRFGDFATNIALVLTKVVENTNPVALAERIKALLPSSNLIARVEVVKPGFINFFLNDAAFQTVVNQILEQKSNYGRHSLGKDQAVHIEMVSANPTGPLHVGHGRLAAYGACVANLLEALGYKVHREYYVNDAGRQMQILALSIWLRYLAYWGEEIAFPPNAYCGDYVIKIAHDLAKEHGKRFLNAAADLLESWPEGLSVEIDEDKYIDELKNRAQTLLGKDEFQFILETGLNAIFKDIQEDLAEFGVVCDNWFHESKLVERGELEKAIKALEDGGALYEKEGAIWFRATDFGDEKDRVILRKNGEPTYFATDIAYHYDKFEHGYNLVIDVLGADHHGYAPRIRAVLQALGKNPNSLAVLLVQFVALYRGKEKISMSTRKGSYVTLSELRKEVGNDAARFFYIMRKKEQHLDFDLELAKSASAENPVYYIQYAHARICSVFRQLKSKGFTWQETDIDEQSLGLLNKSVEKILLGTLSRYPEIVETAGRGFEPHLVAHYLQTLANDFHTYYNAEQFIVPDAKLRSARMALVAATKQVLINGLFLLGVSAPETM